MSDREAARDILRELLEEALGRTNGHAVVPQIPPPPVAAVHRPSTWRRPPEGAEVIGGGAGAAPARAAAGAEPVALESDADLDRFVRALLARFEDPQAREAIRAGRLRFTLAGRGAAGQAAPATPGVVRVERGAVTERTVASAAKAGGRLVLGRGAVLTPLAREKARASGIEIERE
jgi:hypothetical protein